MKNPSHSLRSFGFFLFLIYFVGVMFFILKLNPLLFSQETLSESLRPEGINSSMLTFPTSLVSKWTESSVEASYVQGGVNRLGTRFKMKKFLHWDRESPSSWGLVEDQIYFIDSKSLVVFGTDGEEQWEFSTNRAEAHLFIPDFSTKSVFVSSLSGQVYSLDRGTGEMKWFIDLNRPILSSPLLLNDGVYIVIGVRGRAQLVRIHPGSGRLKWVSGYEFSFLGDSLVAHPDLGYIFIGGDDRVFALNSSDGELIWSAFGLGRIDGNVMVANQTLYLVNERGWVFALEAQTGEEVWKYSLGQRALGPLVHVPKHEMVAVVSEDSHLHAIEGLSGEERWRVKVDNESPSKAVASVRLNHQSIARFKLGWGQGGWSIWSPCGKHQLCVFNPENGRVLDEISLLGRVSSRPYFGDSGFFLSLDRPTISQRKGTKETHPWAIVQMVRRRPKPKPAPVVPAPDFGDSPGEQRDQSVSPSGEN